MWIIHNKYYDLSEFKYMHPGGCKILEECEGIDATAAFESYHALSNIGKIRAIMKNYEVSGILSASEQKYTFNEDDFYCVVRKRVREHFNIDGYTRNSKTNSNTKWTWVWMFYAVRTFVFYSASFICTFCYTSYPFYIRAITSVISGTTLMQWLFQVYHDASHGAVSKHKQVNKTITLIGSGIAFWDSTTWISHHCISHHSFTGDYKLDPDMKHTHPFLKKSIESKADNVNSFEGISFILSIFPGMYFGQVLSYLMVQYKMKLWNFVINARKTNIEWVIILFQVSLMMYGGSYVLVALFFLSLNVNYSIGILPDHDLFETNLNHKDGVTDWGELQVRHSGNFAPNNRLYTLLYGGINYQIEHHLFPSLCSYHLPSISHIVRETCKEFDIKYVSMPTVKSAYLSAINNLVIINSVIHI